MCDFPCWLAFSHSFLSNKFAQLFLPVRCSTVLVQLSVSEAINQGWVPNLLPISHTFLSSLFFHWAKSRSWGLIIRTSHTNEQFVVPRLWLYIWGLVGRSCRSCTCDFCSFSSFGKPNCHQTAHCVQRSWGSLHLGHERTCEGHLPH